MMYQSPTMLTNQSHHRYNILVCDALGCGCSDLLGSGIDITVWVSSVQLLIVKHEVKASTPVSSIRKEFKECINMWKMKHLQNFEPLEHF